VDLLSAARTSDEEQDLEDLATTGHGENLRHPGADPFKVLRRLDDPDKSKAARRSRTVGVGSDNLTNVGNLVRDADTSRPEHDSTIGRKIFATWETLA
jgi:hypothetical protein